MALDLNRLNEQETGPRRKNHALKCVQLMTRGWFAGISPESDRAKLQIPMITRLIFLGALLLVARPALILAVEPARIVFMIGEDEYHTWETLPEFAEKQLAVRGYLFTIVHSDPADKNSFPGLVSALRDADLLFLSVRRRTPKKEQLDAVKAFLAAGKPLVAIRTACHAFALTAKDKAPDSKFASWQEFDSEVLGGHYVGHHLGDSKNRTLVKAVIAPGAYDHQIVQGISVANLVSDSLLYKVSPLEKGTTCLLIGEIPGQPVEPIAWTHLYGTRKTRVFFTSFGAPNDFKSPEFRRLLFNGVVWALGK